MRKDLFDRVLGRDDLAELDIAQRRLELRRLVVESHAPTRQGGDIGSQVAELADEIDGHGPISGLMRAPGVTDVLINGPFEIWVERAGETELTEARFRDTEHLDDWIERLLGRAGAGVDAQRPIADARLDDGARVHVVLPPVAPDGPIVSIRRWPDGFLTLDQLLAATLLTDEQASRLAERVRARATMVVAGGTGTGKTTLLNALLGIVCPSERVVVIEETAELRPCCRHYVSLITRIANVEGRGKISMQELVRCALRMRPDRIVVGEVRGPEALAALDAMSTGHEGSMLTIHARSCEEAVERMVTLALSAGGGRSEASLRRRVTDAFEVVIYLERTERGRRVTAILDNT